LSREFDSSSVKIVCIEGREKKMSKTIAAIDDSPSIIFYLKEMLEGEGHLVFTFHNPLEAVKEIPTLGVDLVITDYMMFDMDGIEVIDRLLVAGIDVNYILYTSDHEPDVVEDCASRGIKLIYKDSHECILKELKCLL
jgi:CheY-like chemotaxis protein